MASKADVWPWVTKKQAAEVTGYSLRNFTERIQPRLDPKAVRGNGAKWRVDIRAVGSTLVAYVAELNRSKSEAKPPKTVVDEIEEETARIKLQALRGKLVNKQVIEEQLEAFISAMAQSGRAVAQKFGNDVANFWNDRIEFARNAWMNSQSANDRHKD